MSITAVEGVVDHGVVRPTEPLTVSDGTKVFIIVPGTDNARPVIESPRLLRPEQADDFRMKVSDD